MEPLEALSSSLFALLQDSSKSDVKLVCPGEGEVFVHDLILSARSPVFDSMLRSDMIEKKTGTIIINDFGIGIVKEMVHFIYTAKIENESLENLKNLLVIADKYQISSLIDVCSKKLVENISKENVLKLAAFGETLSADLLVEACANNLADDLSILDNNLEEELKASPLFLTKVLGALKRSKPGLTVSRFTSTSTDEWTCDWPRVDSISFATNREAKLLKIGLYGNQTLDKIPIDVTVRKGRLDSSIPVMRQITTYRSNGTTHPINVPINVKIEKYTEYTISVCIKSSEHGTFSGDDGKCQVILPTEGFEVSFMNTTSCPNVGTDNGTSVEHGQIPTLKFAL